MKRILLLILICCHLLPATAQKNAPKWMDKSKKAVVLITTYGKDGAKLTSGTGIFVSETGKSNRDGYGRKNLSGYKSDRCR